MILYLTHIDIEGPETLGDFFSRKGVPAKTLNLHNGDPLPENLDGITAVVCLGGPMNVYEEDKYAFLAPETAFIQKLCAAQIPYLGICLGSQLLAKALGARVAKSPVKEIGFYDASLTPVGEADPLFKGITTDFPVYHWHEDMWLLPQGALLLASGSGCPNQAFRYGKNAYGLQFHVEITDEIIRSWADAYIAENPECESLKRKMLDDYEACRPVFEAVAGKIYNNFMSLLALPRSSDADVPART